MLTRFDGYTATTRAGKYSELVGLLIQQGTDRLRQGRGHHGFKERVAVCDVSGFETGSISWGGSHGDLVMVEVKGERTPHIVERLRSTYEHRCTRVDSCYDVDEIGAFDSLLTQCIGVKKQFKLKGSKAGDWEDFPEDGRTLYLGAQASPVRSRLYEKGRQPEYRHLNRPNWIRLELQVRPSKDAKDVFSKADSLAVWGASAWSKELASRVLAAELPSLPAGTVYRQSETERAIAWMCKQYGPHLLTLRNDLGSWESVGLTLAEIIRKEKKSALRNNKSSSTK